MPLLPARVTSRYAASQEATPAVIGSTFGVHGAYIDEITADGKTWLFESAPIFQARIYSTLLAQEFDLTATDFTITGSTTVDGVTTFTLESNAPLTGLTIKLRLYKEQSGVAFGAPEVFACPATIAVMTIRFPYQAVLPYGTAETNFGVVSSRVYPEPHLELDPGGSAFIAPPGTMYGGIYDAATKACLMIWCDDEAGHLVKLKMQGQTTSTLFFVEHVMDRRYTGGTLSAKTYKVHFESFTGLCNRGEMCHQDFSHRFRQWFTHPARPWMMRGRWYDSADVSPRIKNKALVFGAQLQGWTSNRVALMRLVGYLGGGEKILARWNFSPNDFTSPPDAFAGIAISEDYFAELATIQAAGVDATVYTLTTSWMASLVGQYNPANYSTFGDIRGAFMRSKAGVLLQTVDAHYLFDHTDPLAANVRAHLIESYHLAHGANEHPHGIYLDVNSLRNNGGQLSTIMQEDDPADNAWTFANHQSGLRSASLAIRNARRLVDPNYLVTMENPDPHQLIAVDFAGMWGSDSPLGGETFGMQYIYCEHLRMARLDAVGLFGPDVVPGFGISQSQVMFATIQLLTYDWLAVGIIAVCDRSTSGELVAADVEGGNFYGPMWEWVKYLVEIATGEGADYFRGRRMRSLGNDFTITYQSSSGNPLVLFNTLWEFPIQEAVWRAADGRLGIFIAHCFRADLTYILGTPTADPRTVTIALDHRAYDLGSGPKVLVRNDLSGNRTLVAKWTTTIEVDVVVDPFTVAMFEVLEDNGEDWS